MSEDEGHSGSESDEDLDNAGDLVRASLVLQVFKCMLALRT